MGLQQKQSVFTVSIAKLILYADSIGYDVTFGDCYRDSRCDYGSKNSNHRVRLAVDLNLFKNGKYLTDGDGHSVLHDYWDIVGGAKRIKNDLNHYSFEHKGRR